VSTLFLCGAGNSEGVRLARAVERASHRWDRLVLLDDDPAKQGSALLGVPIAGGVSELAHAEPGDELVNLVTRSCARRDVFQRKLSVYAVPSASLVHPTVDTDGATLAPGTTVYAGATIGPESIVDSGSVVFMGAVVGHEAWVGSGCVVAANAVLNARVRLGDRVYVGSNATVVPEVTVGADATIAVGSAVLGDIPAGVTAMGIPAEIFQTHGGVSSATRSSVHVADQEFRRAIAGVWQEILHLDHVGDDENFFDLGGSSLTACHVSERLRSAIGHEVRVLDIFRYPSVGVLAAHLWQKHAAGLAPTSMAGRAEIRKQLRQRLAAG
jgi:acetyltransferase-like isoleucine patch superfamily enzyme